MQVLYATDGSDAAAAAGDLIAAVGNRSSVELTVLSVVDAAPLFPQGFEIEPGIVAAVRARHVSVARAASERLRAEGFGVVGSGEVREGRPWRAIVAAGAQARFDLVVVGAGGHSRLGNLLMGSTSTHVLHSWPESVLVVHEAPGAGRRVKVLVATDGSAQAEYAASTLAHLSDPSRCEVTVLSVAEVAYVTGVGYPFAVAPGADADLAAELVESALARAGRTADTLRRAGFHADVAAEDGGPQHVVLTEADKRGYDLVVVGSRGRGSIRSLLDSVSDAVARHARAALVGRTAG